VEILARWSRRFAVVTTMLVATVLMPAMAWASTSPTALAVGEVLAARRRSRSGFSVFGLFGGLCCLVVVGGIVLGVLLVARRKRGRGPQ